MASNSGISGDFSEVDSIQCRLPPYQLTEFTPPRFLVLISVPPRTRTPLFDSIIDSCQPTTPTFIKEFCRRRELPLGRVCLAEIGEKNDLSLFMVAFIQSAT